MVNFLKECGVKINHLQSQIGAFPACARARTRLPTARAAPDAVQGAAADVRAHQHTVIQCLFDRLKRV